MKIFAKSKGFTLIEIVIVIGIMAVFSAVIYSSFDKSRAKSRDQQRVSDISTIQLALEQYFQKNGVYPVQLDDLVNQKYISVDMINNYKANYFPITKTNNSNYCISYHLWTTFELTNQYLTSKRGFNSNNLSAGYFECGISPINPIHGKIDASPSNSLVYDVMP